MANLHERMLSDQRINPGPSEYQADAHSTELPGPAVIFGPKEMTQDKLSCYHLIKTKTSLFIHIASKPQNQSLFCSLNAFWLIKDCDRWLWHFTEIVLFSWIVCKTLVVPILTVWSTTSDLRLTKATPRYRNPVLYIYLHQMHKKSRNAIILNLIS